MTNATSSNESASTEQKAAEQKAADAYAAQQNAKVAPDADPDGDASAPDAANEEDAAADDEGDALEAQLEAAREEQEETNNRLLRTAAELQNVRRRGAEEQKRRAASAKASALRPMLDVLDDLQRALDAADGDQPEAGEAFASLRNGVQMVNDKFESALKSVGVEPIEAEGQPFDENEHEAMMQQPAPAGTEPGTVLAEIRRGYRIEASGEARVLRHSRVVVATAAAGEDAEAEKEDHAPTDG